ncbi:hypothetical protein V5O48_010097 [Marasmius crinis-equi]|uniref:Uncharacterized protein n=1 Tax=Marasmius crinis-equi TaxID=585013 RepID=A0ABR3F9E3_9AGAR
MPSELAELTGSPASSIDWSQVQLHELWLRGRVRLLPGLADGRVLERVLCSSNMEKVIIDWTTFHDTKPSKINSMLRQLRLIYPDPHHPFGHRPVLGNVLNQAYLLAQRSVREHIDVDAPGVHVKLQGGAVSYTGSLTRLSDFLSCIGKQFTEVHVECVGYVTRPWLEASLSSDMRKIITTITLPILVTFRLDGPHDTVDGLFMNAREVRVLRKERSVIR